MMFCYSLNETGLFFFHYQVDRKYDGRYHLSFKYNCWKKICHIWHVRIHLCIFSSVYQFDTAYFSVYGKKNPRSNNFSRMKNNINSGNLYPIPLISAVSLIDLKSLKENTKIIFSTSGHERQKRSFHRIIFYGLGEVYKWRKTYLLCFPSNLKVSCLQRGKV